MLRFRVVDVVLVGALTALACVESLSSLVAPRSPAYVALTVPLVTVPLLFRRLRPEAAAATMLGGLVLQAALGSDLPGGVAEPVALVVMLYSLAAHLPLRRALVVLAGAAATLVVVVGLGDARAGNFVYAETLVVLAWLSGRGVRLAEERSALLADNRAMQERSRIARELHDVVSHNVSAIVVQAAAERRDLPGDHPTASALADIEQHGRETLQELRKLLGLLRVDADGSAPLAPQPGLGDLAALIESARGRGIRAELMVQGEQREVGDGLGLAVYRVVQESLTNVGKHTVDGRAEVRLRWGEQTLQVDVVSSGEPAPRGRSVPGAGYGLQSMAERVRAQGGELLAVPGLDGFAVHATFPLVEVS